MEQDIHYLPRGKEVCFPIDKNRFSKDEWIALKEISKGEYYSWNEYPEFVVKFKNDFDVAKICVIASPSAFKWVARSVLDNVDFAKIILEKDPNQITSFEGNIKNNKELAMSCLKNSNNPDSIVLWGWNVISDKDIVKMCLKKSKDASCYQKIAPSLKEDFELATIAVRKSSYNLEYVSDELKRDKRIIRMAIHQSPLGALNTMGPESLVDKDLLLYIFKVNCLWLADHIQFVKKNIEGDTGILMERAIEEGLRDKQVNFFIKALKKIDRVPIPKKDGQGNIERVIKVCRNNYLAAEWLAMGIDKAPHQLKEEIVNSIEVPLLKSFITECLLNRRISEIGQALVVKSNKKPIRKLGVKP